MRLDLLLCLFGCLRVSLLQIGDQLIIVLVQINLVGDDPHSIFYLGRELANFIEFLQVKSRFTVEVYELVLFVLQYLLHLVAH